VVGGQAGQIKWQKGHEPGIMVHPIIDIQPVQYKNRPQITVLRAFVKMGALIHN
jgi:hypothetical protein